MFGIDSGELLIIAIVALVVIGPKDLPRAMRTIGQFIGRARGMATHFRSGVDAMIRESELADMEKKWQADNERIMREHPAPVPALETGKDKPAAPGPDDEWAEPVAALPQPARAARVRPGRPKAPPRRSSGGRPAAAAPPVPGPDPGSPPADEGA
jgi:sec-independent protein translocase protein TatB